MNLKRFLLSQTTETLAPEGGQTPELTVVETNETLPAQKEAPPKEKPWYEVRISQLTARNKSLEEEAGKKTAAPPVSGEIVANPVLDSKTIEARAAEIAATREFNKTCDDIAAKGKEAYADFDSKIGNFPKLGGLTPGLIEAAIEAGPAHQILYYLGEHMDEAAKVLTMSPLKMAVAVAKLGDKLSKGKPVSNVEDPIKPLSGRSTTDASSANPDDMPLDKWMAWREKQVEAKRR